MSPRLDAAEHKTLRGRLDRPPKVEIGSHFQKANAASRSPAWLGKLLAAIRGPGKLTIDEFFYYQLYRPEYTAEDCRLFVGKKQQARFHDVCNNSHWFAAAHDKALFYTIMRGADLPVPETLAVVSAEPRHGYHRTLSSAGDLDAFFQGRDDFPLFAKPIDGMYSLGTLKLLAGHSGVVSVSEYGEVPLAEVYDYMRELSESGYLIQRTLLPAPELAPVTGEAVASLRALVLLGEEPRIVSAVVKIPRGGSIADNFWRVGNALGAVDHHTGEITRIVVNGPDGHAPVGPDDARLSGLIGGSVPQWAEASALACEAATVFPRVRTQSWDIALSSTGPVLMEFNFGGDLNLHQIAHGRGALVPDYVAHLTACGYRGRLS